MIECKCDKCESDNVQEESEYESGEHGEGYVTDYLVCLDCGYRE